MPPRLRLFYSLLTAGLLVIPVIALYSELSKRSDIRWTPLPIAASLTESQDRVEIVGSRGTIAFATFEDRPVELTIEGQTTRFEIPHPPHVQQPLIQTVVDALTGRGICPSTGTSAARTSWVMDQMLESHRRRHAPP